MAADASVSADAIAQPRLAWEDLEGMTSESIAEYKAAGLTPATARLLQRLNFSSLQSILVWMRVCGGFPRGLPPIQAAKLQVIVDSDGLPAASNRSTACLGPGLTWDQLPDITSEGKAELREAGVTPATAQVLQALGYTQAGDLCYISDQVLSQCLGLPLYHIAMLRATVQAGAAPAAAQADAYQLLPPETFDRVKHLDPQRDSSDLHQLCMGCGGIVGLVALLSSKDNAAVAQAAWALKCLAWSGIDAKDSVVALGGVAPLFPLLTSSCGDVQEQAVGALAELLSSCSECTEQAQAPEILNTLVALLSSRSVQVQKGAASTLHGLTYFRSDATERALNAGAVPPLGALLGSDSPDVRRITGCVLYGMAGSKAAGAAEAVAAAAGVQLTGLLTSGSEGERAKGAEGIGSIGLTQELAERLVAAGAVPLLVGMLSGGRLDAREKAAGALHALMQKDGVHATPLVLAEGAIAPLVALLPPKDAPEQKEEGVAEVTLRTLVYNSKGEGNREALAAAGAMPLLLPLLSGGPALFPLTKDTILDALRDLAAASGEHADAVAAAGGIMTLVALLSGGPARLLPTATELLTLLMKGSEECRAAAAAAGAVAPLVALLSGSVDEMPPGRVAEALASLAEGSEERRAAIVAAGGADALR